jgi:ABC-type polar amino acid transport system ATPase subunit
VAQLCADVGMVFRSSTFSRADDPAECDTGPIKVRGIQKAVTDARAMELLK